MRRSWVGLALVLMGFAAKAQVLHNEVSLAGQYGFFWAHSEVVKQLRCHPRALWLSVAPARWATVLGLESYRRGRFGATIGWMDFGRADLGHALPAMVYFENASRPEGAPSAFFYRISAGLTALTHPYQMERNPSNLAYAAPWAWSLQARVGVERRVGSAIVQAGLNLTHYSNGSFRLPNAGLNLPAVFLSLGYSKPSNRYVRPQQDSLATRPYRHFIDLTGAIGWKSADIFPARLYPSGLGRVAYRYGYGRKGDLALGFDWIYNPALEPGRELLGKPDADFNRLAVTVGHEWYLAQAIALSTHLGIYVRDPLPIDKPIYQRYGVRFMASRRLQPAIWLRAHLGKADCVEFALTYSLWRR